MCELSEKRVKVKISTKNKFVVFETGTHYFHAFEEDVAALRGNTNLTLPSTDRAAVLLVNSRTLLDGIGTCYLSISAENSGSSFDSFTPKPHRNEQVRKKPDFGITKIKIIPNQPRPNPVPRKPVKKMIPGAGSVHKCPACNGGILVRGYDGLLHCNYCLHSEP